MTEPTVASAVLQDDGRYLVTLSNGKTYYGPVGAGAPLTVSVTIPPVTVDTTGLATDAKQDTGNTSLGSIATNTTGLAKESGGNLAAAVAALVPASVTGDLAAADDTVVLATGSARGVALLATAGAGADQVYVLEAQLPGSGWFGVAAVPNGAFASSAYAYAPGDPITAFEAAPLLALMPAGAVTLRARCTSGSAGSLTLTLTATDLPGPLGITGSGGFGTPAGPITTVQDARGDPFPPGPLNPQPISVHANRNNGPSIDINPTLQGISSNQFFAYTVDGGGFVGTYKFQGLYGVDAYDLPVFDLDAHAWLAPGAVLSGPGRFVVGNDVSSTWGDNLSNLDNESIAVQALALTHTGGDLLVYLTEMPFPQVYGAPGVPGPAVLTVQGDPGGTPVSVATIAAHHAASTVTIASGAGTVAARPGRTTAILYCPASNAADVLLGGVMPIPKGVWTPVAATDAITVTGTNGDVMQVVEVYN